MGQFGQKKVSFLLGQSVQLPFCFFTSHNHHNYTFYPLVSCYLFFITSLSTYGKVLADTGLPRPATSLAEEVTTFVIDFPTSSPHASLLFSLTFYTIVRSSSLLVSSLI